MVKNKKNLYVMIITLILLTGGSIVGFLTAIELNRDFWTSYVSSIFCLIYLAFSLMYFLKSKDGEEPARFSLITCALLYIFTTVIIIILGATGLLNANFYLATHIVSFVIYLTLLIYNIGSHGYIAWQDIEVNKNKLSVNTLHLEIIKMQNDVSYQPNEVRAEIGALLDKLQEKVRFMDPMTNKSVTAYEVKIKNGITDLESILHNSLKTKSVDIFIIKGQVQQLIDTIAIRNETLKNSK